MLITINNHPIAGFFRTDHDPPIHSGLPENQIYVPKEKI